MILAGPNLACVSAFCRLKVRAGEAKDAQFHTQRLSGLCRWNTGC